jgi:hypothetical protein
LRKVRSIRAGVAAVGLALAACAPGATLASPAPGETAAAITAEDLRRRIGFLASDELRGRDTGSPGLRGAAEYLAGEMARLRLEPAGDGGTYLQRVPLERRFTSADVTVNTQDGSVTLTDGEILPASGLGGLPMASATSGSGPLVFGGRLVDPGVQVEELTLSQLRGAVVIVRLGVPEGVDPMTTQPRLPIATLFSPSSPAAAVLLVAEEAEVDFWEYAAEVTTDGALFLAAEATPAASAPPFFLISAEAAERLIGSDLAEADQPRTGLGTVEFAMNERVEEVEAWNVAAILRGSDPARADEFVGLGAHYDHVGVGTPVDGDSIYNGADDNASGTAALVEVAEALAHLPSAARPARSTLFVWKTAEEAGLLGSEYFTDRPTVSRSAIIAHLNLDMVGRNHPDSLSLVGSRRISTELGDLVEEVNAALDVPFDLDYTYDEPGHPEQVYCRSDHYNYARYGIPVVFLSTGLHDDYHAPSDQPELIDYDKAAHVSEFVLQITQSLGDRPNRLAIDQTVPPLGTPCTG